MTGELHNRTRRSASIPRALLRRGRVLEVPLYYLLRASDLAREGLDRSGSHRFADHIYRGTPSGRGAFGRWLDARLLALPATQAFRFRYSAVRDALTGFLLERLADAVHAADTAVIDVLSVPCGIPRELADAAAAVRARGGEGIGRLDRVVFHGLDLDPEVLDEACAFAAARGLRGFETHLGDALERASYPAAADFIGCTGLGDFLDDGALARLYEVLFDVLRPGGVLVTSGMERRRGADYLLRLAEIRTRYRSAAELVRLVERLPFREVTARRDETGIQTVVTARR
jgi:SAM-dependent methyltransferase